MLGVWLYLNIPNKVTAVTLFGIFKYNQTPNLYGTLGLILIISGVIILNTFGKVK